MVIGKKLRLSIPHSKTSLHWVDQGVLVSYVNHLQFVDQSAFLERKGGVGFGSGNEPVVVWQLYTWRSNHCIEESYK